MKRALLVSTGLIGILAGAPVYATDTNAVMAQLKAMQSQMAQMQAEMAALKAELEKTKAQAKSSQKITDEIKAAKLSVKPENDVKISMVPAPKFETADGAYSFKVGGFAQVDGGMFNDDRRDHPDGTNMRRARLSATGTIAHDFKYKLEYDFAGTAGPAGITDTYLEYTGLKPLSFMVGQFKEPFGLETLTSDLFTTFMERALPLAFAPDRNLGIAVATSGDSPLGAYTASLGGFGSGTGTASTDDESKDVTARLTLAPFSVGREILHFGVAGSHRIPDSATDSFRFSSRAENRLSSSQAVDTGAIASVDNVDLLGLEAAGVYGPFSMQGEYMIAEVNRGAGLANQSFDTYYVEASYFLTGESRNYVAKQGKFDRVKPKWAFKPSEGAWGAWQVSTRYSALDLNDSVILGGEVNDLTFGLRWIPQENVNFTVNYIMVNTDGTATTAHDDPEILMMRAQFDF
jgi:phosphate-selective porin OprO/OprP